MHKFFFYGSLRDHALTEIVLGRVVAREDLRPAQAPDHAARRFADQAYPLLLPRPGEVAQGVVLMNATDADLDRLSFFEEAEYGLAPITALTDAGPVEAVYFRATDKRPKTDLPWEFAHWQTNDRTVAIEAAIELMTHFGKLPLDKVDTIWPGIMIRAQQRARALAEVPRLGAIRTAFERDAVVIEERRRPYTGFLAVQELRLTHRRHDGGWMGPVSRSVVLWGDAVTILPYDPARDRVLLIEQFRPAPAARGGANPWCIEVVAGRIDSDDTPEQTARREAREEAGLSVGRVREIGAYYTTGGLAAEHMTSFVAEADLPGEGGLHGLASEHEDIRTMVLDFNAALQAVTDGAVNTGPALTSLLWLAVHREALRRDWLG